MARVKRGVTAHAKHKKVLKKAKGYYGRRKNTIRVAKQAVEKAHAVSATATASARSAPSARSGSSASMRRCASTASPTADLSTASTRPGIAIDRKVLADIAVKDAAGFKALVDQAAAQSRRRRSRLSSPDLPRDPATIRQAPVAAMRRAASCVPARGTPIADGRASGPG